ncbi:MAG: tetratricopeptide repeat protein [Rhodobacteraceae bacterium]|nr:tetratricopeptide repeat protein [Paracoccaceae bacterium]
MRRLSIATVVIVTAAALSLWAGGAAAPAAAQSLLNRQNDGGARFSGIGQRRTGSVLRRQSLLSGGGGDLERAEELLEQNQAEEALRLFEAALGADPGSPEAQLGRAEALSRLGRHDEALALLERLTEVAPLSEEVKYRRGLALFRSGAADRAAPIFEAAARAEPNNWRRHWRLGDSLYAVRDWQGALRAYQTALDLAGGSAPTGLWRSQGDAFIAIDAVADAEASYSSALGIDVADASTRLRRAQARRRAGNLSGAAEDLDYLINNSAELASAEVWIAKGDVALAQGDRSGALASFENALSAAPDSPQALLGMARALVALNRLPEAAQLIDTLSDLTEPGETAHTDALFVRGQLLFARRNYAAADEAYTAALRARPRDPNTHYNRALARIGAGDPGGAVDDLAETITLRPEDADALYALGRTTLALGDSSNALAAFERAEDIYKRRLSNGNPPPYLSRGLALMALGRADGAIAEFDAALAAQPDDAEAITWKAEALLRLERPNSARDIAIALTQLRPDDPAGHVLTARAQMAIGHAQEALEALDEAAAHGADAATAARLSGDAWRMAAEQVDQTTHKITALRQALRAYEAEIEASQGLAEAYARRAAVLTILGKHAEAKADLDQAVTGRPDNAGLRFARAAAWRKLGDCDKAIRDYDSGLAIDTGNSKAYSDRASCKLYEGRLLGAVIDGISSIF